MSINIPVTNQAFSYINNLQLAWASATTLTVSAGQARDSTNVTDLLLAAPLTINSAIKGINGLDTGTIANSTLYAVYLLSSSLNSVVAGAILSISASTPTMPLGYDTFRRIGWVRTDGSANFLKFYQTGGAARYYQYDTPITVLSAGAATSFTAASLASAAPAVATPVYLNVAYTPAVAGNTCSIRPTGSTVAANAAPLILSGDVAAKAQDFASVRILPQLATGVPSLDYVVQASDALTLSVVGFEDYV